MILLDKQETNHLCDYFACPSCDRYFSMTNIFEKMIFPWLEQVGSR